MPSKGTGDLEPPVEYATCPECGHERVVATEFSRSAFSTAPFCHARKRPIPRLTSLAPWHYADARGYTICPSCGLVIEGTALEAPAGGAARAELKASHRERLLTQAAGFDAYAFPRAFLKSALTNSERSRVRRLSSVLYDTEALLSATDTARFLREDVVAAVEAYYTSDRRGGQVSYEAIVSAILLEVASARRCKVGSEMVWAVFDIPPKTQTLATKRVREWFASYWQS